MRCKNCGWDNPSGLTYCEKCNTPLEGGVSNYAGTAVESSNAAPIYGNTVCEASASPNIESLASANPVAGTPERCPKCGYPLRSSSSVCPKCHYVIGHVEKNVNNHVEPAATVSEKKTDEPTRFGSTIMPGMKITSSIWFSLTPIAHQGESELERPKKVEFEDKHVELNRDNIDPKNRTITSKVQAVMDYDDKKNRWYIQDKSALRYTFVRCADEMPLMDGDEVLMGDRRFIFHAETPQAAQQMEFTGTIAVGRQRVNAPKCSLTPIVDEGEQDAPTTQTFRGDVHQLNRANLDPENHTITSKVQAILNFEDGNWYIKDESSLKTTFMYCADPIDLKDGDMILMGNRTFIFNC